MNIQYSNFKDLFRSRIFHDDHFASWFDKIFEILDLQNFFNVLLMWEWFYINHNFNLIRIYLFILQLSPKSNGLNFHALAGRNGLRFLLCIICHLIAWGKKKMSNSCIHLVHFEISRDFLFILGATTWSSLVLTKPEWSWFQSDPRDDTLVHRQTFEKVSTYFCDIWDHLAQIGTLWDHLRPFLTIWHHFSCVHFSFYSYIFVFKLV